MKTKIGALVLCACMAVLSTLDSAHAQIGRIINGHGASEGEWPWMVTIFPAGGTPANPSTGHFCGGVLIAPQYVVTAAHCVSSSEGYPEDIEVVVGRTRLSSSAGSRSLVQSIVVHPNFDNFLLRNDIALLKLTAPVPQQPVDLVVAGDEALWSAGTNATIIGWGQTNPIYPILPDLLQEAVIPIQSDATCQEDLGLLFDSSAHLCAGVLSSPGSGDGVDACYGDSGSPLLVPDGLGWKLAGLTSWGFECASSSTYGVYTRVASYSSWVYSFPPAPPYLRSYPTLAPYEGSAVGTSVTCLPGNWSGDDLQYNYQWFRAGDSQDFPIAGAQNATYTLSSADVSTYVYCLVTASNSSGVANGVSDWVGPVYDADPVPTVTPLDVAGPLTTKRGAFCKKHRCQIEVSADDDQNSVAGVEGTVSFQPKGCNGSAGGSKACVAARRARILDATQTDTGTWKFSFKVKGAGSGQIMVRGRDSVGNIQARPTKVKFSAS